MHSSLEVVLHLAELAHDIDGVCCPCGLLNNGVLGSVSFVCELGL